MSVITQKKLVLSDIQKDIKKRMKDFDEISVKLNSLRKNNGVAPKSKGLFSTLLGR